MYIQHIALGGCLTAPSVQYGLTEDTGGHIAYILGAAAAQARRPDISGVDIVTRAFDDPTLGRVHAQVVQDVGPKLRILRLETANRAYLSKEALAEEIPALTDAYLDLLLRADRRPDVIHAHFADAARLAWAASQHFGVVTAYTPHSLGIDKRRCMDADRNPVLDRRIDDERRALLRSDAVIVSSRDEAERQVQAYGADVDGWVHRVPPGVPPLDAAPGDLAAARALVDPLLDSPARPLILAIARPVMRKNLIALVRAYADDPALRAATNLVILAGQDGNGAEETGETRQVIDGLRQTVLAEGLTGRVALPPRHGPREVAQLYRLAAARRGVFANPSFHEPFGLTLLEAAQAGLPVVATREGGPVDIVGTIGHGTLVDPRDTGAIAAAIRGLVFDPVAWDAAARAGRAGIGAFQWDGWADRVARIYGALGSGVRTPRGAPHHLLACDIDHTLTGDRSAATRFSAWVGGGEAQGIALAVATGRAITEARAVLADWDLMEPEIFVTAVGTEIHMRDEQGRLSLSKDYAARLDEGWNRTGALEILEASGVVMQPAVEQRRWKLAAFGTAAEADDLRARLDTAGVAARVVPSHGRLIDVLAPNGGKASAVAFVAAQLGLTLRDCIAAGDSGNDADMLAGCGRGILVANALPEMAMRDLGRHVHRTRTCHADGVLEGLAALGLASPPCFDVARVGAEQAGE
ncbi:HAD-IIB family hydrolase [Jannaschia sp. S6380]|uniref:HAD-IIB family hydrolase n=1 Tax=Jannaschia sp. S6380 TaxID=2926408 RepID=UPI001FF20B4A|nr:HAD-IIB family hydrolase [Jannaschia sp. S6380]MCK0168504.1 HAD-IIB family hydrolase [Jannaschia sp. S6380]